jgi:predicted glycosyltransferase
LVAKKNAAQYEIDVVDTLNQNFDALLIHADPQLVTLQETFGHSADIKIPVVYTGFVAQAPPADAPDTVRRDLNLKADERLVLASAGGGRSGAPLLKAVLRAWPTVHQDGAVQLHVFTGPFMEDHAYGQLMALKPPGVQLSRFSDDFLSMLSAADLSISMGGYNTSMNILATGVPALVWPFPGDREQGLRADRLEAQGTLKALSAEDLDPVRLAAIIEHALCRQKRSPHSIAIDGAKKTAEALEALVQPNGP